MRLKFGDMKNSLINILLRGLAILGKFALILYIVKFLSLSDLGEYNLIATSVAILLFFIGFEFHAYAGRQYSLEKSNSNSEIIYNQLFTHLFIYVFLIPISYLFLTEFVQLKYIFLVYMILVFDHLSQEISRAFVYIKKSIIYNLLFFLKNGGWVYGLIFMNLVFDYQINLFLILKYWLGGSLFSFFIGLIFLKRKGLLSKHRIDFNWIFKGLKVSFPFFIMSVSFRSIEYSDRFMIEHLLDYEKLGIYSFFFGISAIAGTFVTNTIAIQYIPIFIEVKNKILDVRSNTKSFIRKIFLIYFILALGVYIFLPVLIKFLDKAELLDYTFLIWFMLINSVFMSLAVIPQNILYALNHDRVLLISAIIAAIVNLIINYITIPMIGLKGAILGTFLAYLIMITYRVFYLKYYVNWEK